MQEIETQRRISWHVNSFPRYSVRDLRTDALEAVNRVQHVGPSHALSLPWSTSTLSLEVGRATPLFKLETHGSVVRSTCAMRNVPPFRGKAMKNSYKERWGEGEREEGGEDCTKEDESRRRTRICPRGTPESLLLPTLLSITVIMSSMRCAAYANF